MFAFLQALGLRPIEWSQAVAWTRKGSPYVGEVLDAAFAKARAVVVLMTPDEIAYLRPEYSSGEADPETQPASQARPNVLFEAGMAIGRDSDHAILVELGEVRPFSDVAGRHAVRMDNTAAKRKALAQRLETAGCAVDLSGDSWLEAGDFKPPPAPGNGLPLGRKIPAPRVQSRVRLDLRYYARGNGDRLEVVNLGTEAAYDVNLKVPDEVTNFQVLGDLPIRKLPAGKSAMLLAVRTMGPGADHFEVLVTGRTEDNQPINEEIFLSVLG
jgi:hypothetical protein